jgi:hypothetical protein
VFKKSIIVNKPQTFLIKGKTAKKKTKIDIFAGCKKISFTIYVVKSTKKLSSLKAKAPKTLSITGKPYQVTLALSPKSATNITPSFKIAKKYKPYLTIDKVGRIWSKKTYKKGKKSIPITVKATNKKKILKVKVK